MSKFLFLCSIGPVQDFIATARRSRDLWYGSWVLSELSKSVAKSICEMHGFKSLVSPYPQDEKLLDPGTDFNAPNRVLAIIDDFSDEAASQIEKAMMDRLLELRDSAFGNIKGSFDRKTAETQVSDVPEFFWVAIPLNDEDNYALVREKAEAYLAARKNARYFKQLNGTNAFKSSLDGIRESVIPKNAYPKPNDKEREKKIIDLYRSYNARQGEQLSGVDLLKRLGEKKGQPDFPSTSDLAAQPFVKLLDTKQKGLGQKVIENLKEYILNSDYGWTDADVTEKGALLFESRLLDYFPDDKGMEKARKKLDDLLRPFVGEKRPYPYYALLIADGDNMGKIIDSHKMPSDHRKLSGAISKFANQVPGMINNKFEGACIYAGGEDILAYLPLDRVLGCAAALEEEFRIAMADFKCQDETGQTLTPTLSGGIVIAHHLAPLSDVLKLARSAEFDVKKNVEGKNGLAVILSKRSGTERRIIGKWNPMLARLTTLFDYMQNGYISMGTAYELQQLHLDLHGSGIEEEAITNEALRIIERKSQSGGSVSISAGVRDQFRNWITYDQLPVIELSHEMIIAKAFAK